VDVLCGVAADDKGYIVVVAPMPDGDRDVAKAIAVDTDDLHHCPANRSEGGAKHVDDDEGVPNPWIPGSRRVLPGMVIGNQGVSAHWYMRLEIIVKGRCLDIPDPEEHKTELAKHVYQECHRAAAEAYCWRIK